MKYKTKSFLTPPKFTSDREKLSTRYIKPTLFISTFIFLSALLASHNLMNNEFSGKYESDNGKHTVVDKLGKVWNFNADKTFDSNFEKLDKIPNVCVKVNTNGFDHSVQMIEEVPCVL